LKSTGEEEILEDFLAQDEDFLAGEKP
jgi:hypothetical protein